MPERIVPGSRDIRRLLTLSLLAFFTIVLIRTAWLGDDAYITFRTVDNLVAGFGPRWNVDERVQAFTHPLWMLVLAVPYFFTREAYFTSYVLMSALSITGLWLFLSRVAATAALAALGGAALIFSKAFVDYSTSGLENPLTHALLAAWLVTYWSRVERDVSEPRGLLAMWITAGLLMLNRLDLILLVGPASVAASWRAGWRRASQAMLIGLAPLIAWEMFSVVYYGFPFPNTAYAKLPPNVDWRVLTAHGFLYLLDACAADPVTPLVIATGLAATVTMPRRHDGPVAAGVLLYLAYIVRIGGDFMTGRFLAAPLFVSAALLAHRPWRLPRSAVPVAIGGLALLGVFSTVRPPVTSGRGTFILNAFDGETSRGIGDERAFYYRYTGLLRWSRERPLPWNDQVKRGESLRAAPQVIAETNVGFTGYFAGPNVHIIDEYGLGDAFLARRPTEPEWRIGHYLRRSPPGYIASIANGNNVMSDVRDGFDYERIRLITQGPLWSKSRWRAILAMNLRR
jgi:arabinofuranosyltransferase